MIAARNNSNPEVVETLLEAGADHTMTDNRGRSAWDHIQNNGALTETDVYWRLNDLQYKE
jgi:hypothetical protein